MEDKRIIKTKKHIKATLIDMLSDMSYDDITVAELCRRGELSRITFYTHYDSKNALVAEMYGDYLKFADNIYHELQRKNNLPGDSFVGYKNLLTCVLDMFYMNYDFFRHTSPEENPYLFTNFYNVLFEAVNDYIIRHPSLISRYPSKQTTAFLCHGIFGLISSCSYDGMNEHDVRAMAEGIYEIMLTSKLFSPNIHNKK